MKLFKRSAAALLCALAICMLLPARALAAGVIDTDRDTHLTLSYRRDDTPLAGARFDLYRVATVDRYGKFSVTDDFAQFNVDIHGENDEAWRRLASALEGYVLRDRLAPCDSGRTDSGGLVSFPTGAQALTPGLYLVIGYRHTQGGYYYDALPFMVMLPGEKQETNDWSYDVTANVKYDSGRVPDGGQPDMVSRKVLKVWEDEGHEDARPEEVTVQLLRDGEVYDTVTLNAENNWRYTWTELDNRYSWTVAEKEAENYSVVLSREGTTFVLTNTYEENTPDEPVPTEPTSPEPSAPEGPSGPKLPQTGRLWWPVPVLTASGILCVIAGLVRRKGGRDEE